MPFYDAYGENFEKIRVGTIEERKNQKIVLLSTQTGTPVTFQLCDGKTTHCYFPFGRDRYGGESQPVKPGEKVVWNLATVVKGDGAKADRFVQYMRALDEFVIRQAQENAAAWFPGLNDDADARETIRDMYKSVLKDSSGGKYRPSLKLKLLPETVQDAEDLAVPNGTPVRPLAVKDGRLKLDATKFKNTSALKKGSSGIVIAQIGSVWIRNRQWGLTIRATDILLLPKQDRAVALSTYSQALAECAALATEGKKGWEDRVTESSPFAFSDVTKTQMGKKTVYISAKATGANVVLGLAEFNAVGVFGAKKWEETSASTRLGFPIELKPGGTSGADPGAAIATFEHFESLMVSTAYAHRASWFPKMSSLTAKKALTRIRGSYVGVLKKKEGYATKLQTKVSPTLTTVVTTDEKDGATVAGTVEDLTKGVTGAAKVLIGSVWFGVGQWGVTLLTTSFRITERGGGVTGTSQFDLSAYGDAIETTTEPVPMISSSILMHEGVEGGADGEIAAPAKRQRVH
jgi:hypothetical protein